MYTHGTMQKVTLHPCHVCVYVDQVYTKLIRCDSNFLVHFNSWHAYVLTPLLWHLLCRITRSVHRLLLVSHMTVRKLASIVPGESLVILRFAKCCRNVCTYY